MGSALRRVLVEAAGWVLVVTGIAALVLPGPGLLMMFAGLTALARHHAWAARWLGPMERRALEGAAQAVATLPRILLSTILALGVIACGGLWAWGPATPSWWPLDEAWWLPGGVAVAITQVASGLLAIGLLIYSCRRFGGRRREAATSKGGAAVDGAAA